MRFSVNSQYTGRNTPNFAGIAQQRRDDDHQAQSRRFWSLDLCLDLRNVPTTPFHYFVAQDYYGVQDAELEGAATAGASRSFHCFSSLPVELQLQIISSCDMPTLFALMHVSTQTRAYVAPLFWKTHSAEVVYRTTADTLDAYSKGLVGKIPHCADFARHVTRLEVSFNNRSSGFHDGGRLCPEIAHDFWTAVSALFPAVRALSIVGLDPSSRLTGKRGPAEAPGEFDDVKGVLELAPPPVEELLWAHSCDGTDDDVWRLRRGRRADNEEGGGSEWELVKEEWAPKRGILPARRATNRLLEIMLARQLERVILAENSGLKWLREETFLRYATDDGIECPAPECEERFETRQMRNQHIGRGCGVSLSLSIYSLPDLLAVDGKWCALNTPDDVKRVLQARIDRLSRLREGRSTLLAGLLHEFGEEGSEERSEFESVIFTLMQDGKFIAEGEEPHRSALWASVCHTLRKASLPRIPGRFAPRLPVREPGMQSA
ncbi:hypothetical protein HK57_00095 [Aspergillus ustus]|uniref:Uncharacterized protein n=1 Tax=Aspergillus ustus TaxID=40382 RepID=A0A0C1BV68_ASPUT|nr:hypothetical protein HK57_00095 [Aspergillus ustus]